MKKKMHLGRKILMPFIPFILTAAGALIRFYIMRKIRRIFRKAEAKSVKIARRPAMAMTLFWSAVAGLIHGFSRMLEARTEHLAGIRT